jgi:hypothetical protein
VTPNPSPTPLDVFVHSGPAEWWQILAALGPLAVLLGALLAAFIGWNTLRQRTVADEKALAQKREADSRAEWWRRAQWAFEAAMDENEEKQDVGLAVLELLNTSNLAGPEEAEIIAEAWKRPLQNGEATLDLLPPLPDNGVTDDPEDGEQ